MTEARQKLLNKIRAMLNSNGRSEEEAMAFLKKAAEMMATYEVTQAELDAAAKEKMTHHKTAVNDPYEIKRNLSVNVGKFTSCKAYRDREDVICFAGRESDIIFADWLLDTLQRFVMRALREYQADRAKRKGKWANNNLTSSSFVAGCTHRINEKLKELTPLDAAKYQELIVKELGLKLVKNKRDDNKIHAGSAASGMEAGKHARFDRPVGSDGKGRLLK